MILKVTTDQNRFDVDDITKSPVLNGKLKHNRRKSKAFTEAESLLPIFELQVNQQQFSLTMNLQEQKEIAQKVAKYMDLNELNLLIKECNATLEDSMPHQWLYYTVFGIPYMMLLPFLLLAEHAPYLFILLPIIATAVAVGLLLFLHQILSHQLLNVLENYLFKKNRDYLHDGRDCHWKLTREPVPSIGFYEGLSLIHIEFPANQPLLIPIIDIESGLIRFPTSSEAVMNPLVAETYVQPTGRNFSRDQSDIPR